MCLNAARKAQRKCTYCARSLRRFRNRARADLERFQRRGSRVTMRLLRKKISAKKRAEVIYPVCHNSRSNMPEDAIATKDIVRPFFFHIL